MNETPIPQNNSNEDVRKLLLDFYSSEIESHSNLIIGLALVLLAILQIPKLLPNVSDFCNPQTWVFMFTIWIISGSLWYFLMRHFSYGILCKSAIEAPLDGETNPSLVAGKLSAYAHKNSKVLGFPSKYFIAGHEDKNSGKRGYALCYFGFGTVTLILLLFLIGVI
jgi:hypothetical protein